MRDPRLIFFSAYRSTTIHLPKFSDERRRSTARTNTGYKAPLSCEQNVLRHVSLLSSGLATANIMHKIKNHN